MAERWEVKMAFPHIIIFTDINCRGNHAHYFGPVDYIGDSLNDQASSFAIFEGNWAFFEDANFRGQMGP